VVLRRRGHATSGAGPRAGSRASTVRACVGAGRRWRGRGARPGRSPKAAGPPPRVATAASRPARPRRSRARGSAASARARGPGARAPAASKRARAPAASTKVFLRLDANRSGELEEGALGALVAARLDVIARAVVITNGRACALGCRRRARRVRSPHHVTGAGALTFASVRARRARTLRMRANDSEFNTLMNYPTVDLTRLVPRR
jgi:hypothetical protein